MNNIFISEVNPSISSIQVGQIKQLIQDAINANVIITKEDLNNNLKVRLDSIKQNGQAFIYSKFYPGDKISSTILNEYFENINVDLKSLYLLMASIISNEKKIVIATKDDFIKTKTSILELINQLRLYVFLKNNPEYQDAKYIAFNNAVNNTPIRPKALIDLTTKTLRLPPSAINRYSNSRFNLDAAKASVEFLGGGRSNKFDKSFGIENTLDSNPNNFWASVVFSDAVPSHRVRLSHSSTERLLASGKQSGQYYDSNGIVFNIDYNFSRTIEVNNIKLLPIADFPVYVLDICYKTSDSSDQWITFKNFDPTNYTETLDWIEWNGKLTSCTSVRITLEQANSNTLTYHIPQEVSNNNQLWDEIINKKYNELVHNIELDAVLVDKVSLDENQLAYLNRLNELDTAIKHTSLYDKTNSELAGYEALINTTKKEILNVIPNLNQNNLLEINKLQYTCGLRFVEFNNISFEPFGYYESPKFESNANILEVSIDTDESHYEAMDSLTTEQFRETSIEYEIEVSDNISIPIVPISTIIEGDNGHKACQIKDELLVVNRSTYKTTVRFPLPSWAIDSATYYASVQIRKNGGRLSPTVLNSGIGGQTPIMNYYVDIYTTPDNDKYLQITFNSSTYDARSNYTISYMADQKAAIVDLNSILNSYQSLEPESFSSTNKDNQIRISYYPYVEYGIINNTGAWVAESNTWTYSPSALNYSIGVASIQPGGLTVTGTNTLWVNNGVRALVTGSYFGDTGASIKFIGDNRSYRIESVMSNSGLSVFNAISTGFLNNNLPTGLPYVIGKTTEIDGKVFGLDNSSYEPIKVYVNDIKATNKTNYITHEHESFNTQNVDTRIYEYIQAGKNIYLNSPASGKISVGYSWLTQYIKVNALLRSHKTYNSKVTPILRSYTLMIKNNKL